MAPNVLAHDEIGLNALVLLLQREYIQFLLSHNDD